MDSPILVKFAALGALSVLLAASVLAHVANPAISQHWTFEVFATDLRKVDNILIAPDQSIYATLELSSGQGQIIRLSDGERTTILAGLRHPDGLTLACNVVFVTEEVEQGRIIEMNLDNRRSREIAVLRKPEGIELPDEISSYLKTWPWMAASSSSTNMGA